MSIDLEITARLADIATTLELLAGVEADSALKRDTTITARLKRINDSIQGGALEAHTLTSHPDVTAPSPSDGDFFRYSAAISAWINDTMALSDATDVAATPIDGNYLRGNGTVWSNSSILLADLPTINLPDLEDVWSVLSPAPDEIFFFDGTKWNSVKYKLPMLGDVTTTDPVIANQVLMYDGSAWTDVNVEILKPKANWDIGAFEFEALKLLATYDVDDTAADALSAVMTVEDTSSFGGHIYKGMFIDLNYDYNNAAGVDNNRPIGLELDVDITTTAAVFSSCKPQGIKAFIANDASTSFGTGNDDLPFVFKVENKHATQAFTSGAIHLSLDGGTTSGTCVSTQSIANNAGSGDIIAYLGYALCDTGFTGDAVGVKGFISGKNTAGMLKGMESLPSALGAQPAKDLVMAYRGDLGHWLASRASLLVTSTQRATPNAVSTTHLTPTNYEGAGYFEGLLEVDGTLFMDGDLDHNGTNIGFFGTTPVAQAAAYTPTNVTPDRSYDANATSVAELADVLGTLIADLQAYGLLQ